MNKSIGKRLAEARKKIGLTQESFGKPIGLTQNNVTNLESGKVQISILHALAIEHVHKINADWLLNANGEVFLSEVKASTSEEKIISPVLLKSINIECIKADDESGSFSERLRCLIKDRLGISQTDFCKTIGLTPGYLSMVINGKSGPSADLISGVYLHYREHFHWLIIGKEDDGIQKSHTDQTVKEHIEVVKKFKNQERAKKINEQLVLLEKLNPSELNELVDYVCFKVEKNLKASGFSGDFSLPEGKLKNGTEE